MINTISLLFGLIGVIIIVVRAMMADRTLPWFKPAPKVAPKPKKRWPGAVR